MALLFVDNFELYGSIADLNDSWYTASTNAVAVGKIKRLYLGVP
jgi:hypothetical protein